jgi:carboxyl-terminal processing protease
MKQGLIIFLTLVLAYNTIYSQSLLSKTEKLYATGKVWGFLKYYHPSVAKGTFNWDNELIQILPKVEQAKTKEDLSNLFIVWINSIGKINKCNSCETIKEVNYFDKNFDLSWTQDSTIFDITLSQKLKLIEENRFQGESHYLSVNEKAGNVILKKEQNYSNFDYQKENLRLLALFKYWNTIEYFFPYKYQTDKNWNSVLKDMLPKFLGATNQLDYHLAMLELVVSLDDSHAGLRTELLDNYFGIKYIPASFKIFKEGAIITRFYNDSLAFINDIKIGDVIVKAEGKSIEEILLKNNKYLKGSNETAKTAYAFDKIFNGSTDSIEIEFIRENHLLKKRVGRYHFEQFEYSRPLRDKWKILNNNVGYVNLENVEPKEVSQISKDLKNTKSIIFDLRNYPKFSLSPFLDFLNPTPKKFVQSIIPDLEYPGKFYWQESRTLGKYNRKHYKGRVIILVNSNTISYAELYAMGLQTVSNSITIGSQTLGADGNVTNTEFIGGFKTGFSGIGIFYPDSTETQRIGIRIDIEVHPTLEGIKQGRDEVLDKAIEVALK